MPPSEHPFPQPFEETPSPLAPCGERPLATGDGVALEFFIPADLYWFRGHFDGLPILPGVVQLELLVHRQIDRLWPDLPPGPRRIAQLKFKQLITPGTALTVTLRRAADAPNRVSFSIANDGGICSQGIFHF